MEKKTMTALEFLNRITEVTKNFWTKSQVSKVMTDGSYSEKEEMWEQINAAGGYEALAD